MALHACRCCKSVCVERLLVRIGFPLYIWPLPVGQKTSLEDVELYICNECGHLQLQDMDKHTISMVYRDEAFNVEDKVQNNGRLKELEKGNRDKFVNAKVLEIGGGRNAFVSLLPDTSGKWVVDFKVNSELKAGLDGYLEGDFTEIELFREKFDYIFLFHVLEHFNSPDIALQKIRELMGDQGRLYIEVPNFEYELSEIPYYTIFHMHISLFTQCSLICMLEKNGYSCVSLVSKDGVLLGEFVVDDFSDSECCLDSNLAYVNELTSVVKGYAVKLQKFFDQALDGKVAIFGGGGSSSLFLYTFPFLFDVITYAIDSDKKKHGRCLCNGKVLIISEDMIGDFDIKYVFFLDDRHMSYIVNECVVKLNVSEIVS